MLSLLVQFAYLQALDILSTLAFLLVGVDEANPVLRLLLGMTHSPIVALLAIKVVAVCLATYCWRSGRHRLLSRVNVFYALLIAWNLTALVVRAADGGA
jgi:hypothetical protein